MNDEGNEDHCKGNPGWVAVHMKGLGSRENLRQEE